MYLISTVMIVQRILFFVTGAMAAYSLKQAMGDEGIRATMAGGNYRHLQLRRSAGPQAAAPGDLEKGAAA